jgi:uncharacterized repeat protein (TIGR02543 family)
MKHKTLFLFISIISLVFLSCSEDTESSADAASYTVTFAEDGGLIPSQTIKEGECVEKPLLTPSKTGYTFTGWYYTDSSGKESEYPFSIAVTSDLTIRAKYTVNSYIIEFDSNGALNNTGSMGSIICDYGLEYSLPENTFTSAGASFLGWAQTAESSEILYTDGQTVKNLSSKDNDRIILYAIWQFSDYHIITYELSGGENSSNNKRKFLESQVVDIYEPDAAPAGYKFDGWYTDPDYSIESRTTGWQPGTYTDDITLYAKWQALTYTVTLNDRGSTSQVTVAYDDYLADISVPELTGATFGGYYSQPYGEGSMYINSAGKGIAKWSQTEECTLYALWTYEIEYDYSYVSSAASYFNTNPSSYTGAREITLSALTMANGWQFDNWIDENDLPVTKIEAGSSGKRTFSARVSMVNYSITYNMNGGSWVSGYTPLYTFKITSDEIQLPLKFDISRDGYTFDGWYTSEDFSETSKIETIASGTCEDFVLWAKWTEATE